MAAHAQSLGKMLFMEHLLPAQQVTANAMFFMRIEFVTAMSKFK